MLIIQGLVDCSKHLLSHRCASLDIVAPVGKNLGLHNRRKSILLAYDCVPCQSLSILLDRQLRRLRRPDLQHGPPLREAGTSLVVLGAPGAEGVEALCGRLSIRASQVDGSLVDLDTWEHVVFGEDIDEGLTVGGLLVESLLEEYDSREVLQSVRGSEEELAEGLAVGLDILNVDAGEALADGAGTLVSCENALAGSGDVFRSLDQFI